MPKPTPTLVDLIRLAKTIRYTVTVFDGEYRLAPRDGSAERREICAYYTTDRQDAYTH